MLGFGKKKVMLTFDDGFKHTKEILEILGKHQVKATFFVCGQWMEGHRGEYQDIFRENHEIGNHSYSHSRMEELSDEEALAEIDRVQQLSRELVGEAARWFRFPYGRKNERLCGLVRARGMRSAGWTIDTKDWEGISGESIAETVLENVGNGDIILMHTLGEHTAQALDMLIPELKNRDYKMITMSQMARDPVLYTRLRRKKVIV